MLVHIQTKLLKPLIILNSSGQYLNAELPHFLFVDVPSIIYAFAMIGI